MSLFQGFINRALWWRNPPEEGTEDLRKFLYRWEGLFLQIQHVLVWQDPWRSLIWVGAFNVLFWAVVCMEWRFYGLLLTGVTLAACVDCARYHGFLESSRGSVATVFSLFWSQQQPKFRVLSMDELHDYIRTIQVKSWSFFLRVRRLREQQPGILCAELCACCAGLAIAGAAVSGPAVIYSVLMTIMTLPALLVRFPGFMHLLPSLAETAEAENNYLPQTTEEAIRILSLQESPDEHLATAGDGQLYPDLSTMPSIEHSLDYLLEPDVNIPSPRQVDGDSEGSEISETYELRFKTKHFSSNASTSSSGDELTKGLKFRGRAERQSSSDSNESFEVISKDDL